LIVLASALGGVLGFERAHSGKPAGVRTHVLVAGGAALIQVIGSALVSASPTGTGDPGRALHAVITGIGFLGAGTILRDKSTGTVEGLTTAASLFVAAAIGVAAASGRALLACGCTALFALVVHFLGRSRLFHRRHRAAPVGPQKG
jgi:putative Mg2+ transporter-C (MgtC) family protein